MFGFLGAIFSHMGASPGAGSVDQPAAPSIGYFYYLGF
jgi:hypothetical protein